MKKNNVVLLAIILAMAAILGACGSNQGNSQATDDSASNDQLETVKLDIGMLKLTSSAPLFIAIEKGFFEEEGIEANVEWFEAAQPIAVATASGSVDVGATGITASLYNMVAEGQKLYIVADKGREQEGYSSSALMVHTDSPITTIEELKGKKIGITQTGSTFHYMAGRLLEKHGLSLSDVELVPLGKINAMMETLSSKQVDAVLLNEPNITAVVKEGYGKVIAQVGDEIEYQTSGIFFSQKIVDNHDAAVRFMKAYAKASRYYYDAVLVKENGELVPGENYDDVIAIIAKYTDQPEENIKLGMPYMDRDGKLLAEDIKTQIDWYLANKMVEKELDPATIVNTDILDEALEQLGN
ncbi:ABC transporter substrate-binding protein [Paenibacillus abyssi]|uniref:ABC transporter substrate-binding protein n=1 Tax=Paenibacillus abyssi TaxID=1340531 RepID=A0A917LHT6_9BACL|nr:ABC transporter substrate-binding protein [Paenibacillus abyssi]GGG26058.1 ABC transporter substrate-binding protein [Paenibacillus abyssi]